MPKFCFNCGKRGHVYHDCHFPVMSYGGIIYQMRNGIPFYLMVQRTYTPDFKELIRGKFDLNDPDYIQKLISRITLQEVEYIYTYEHHILYKNLLKYCKIKKNQSYYDRYHQSKENYEKLLEGYTTNKNIYVKFSEIVESNNPTYYMEPDWGFPKGRRNTYGDETDMACAQREIQEETGLSPEDYQFKPDYYVTEVHIGSNNTKYAHRYYVGEAISTITCYIDPYNKYQAGEIRKIGWFPIKIALSMIRPYHFEKKKVLSRAHKEITGSTIYVKPPYPTANHHDDSHPPHILPAPTT